MREIINYCFIYDEFSRGWILSFVRIVEYNWAEVSQEVEYE